MKTIVQVITCILMFSLLTARGGTSTSPLWATRVDLNSETAGSPAVDSDGNSLVAGNGLTVYKINPHGHVLWSRHLGNGVSANDITVDSEDNVLVTGSRYDYQTSPTNFSDIWIFKFSRHGHLLWQRTYDS